jgi:PH domain
LFAFGVCLFLLRLIFFNFNPKTKKTKKTKTNLFCFFVVVFLHSSCRLMSSPDGIVARPPRTESTFYSSNELSDVRDAIDQEEQQKDAKDEKNVGGGEAPPTKPSRKGTSVYQIELLGKKQIDDDETPKENDEKRDDEKADNEKLDEISLASTKREQEQRQEQQQQQFEEEEDGILLEAEMYKKGKKRHNWNSRWFVLSHCQVLYYADSSCQKLKGSVWISDMTAIDPCASSASSKDRPHSFSVHTPSRIYFIQAQSAAERTVWIGLLRQLCAAAQLSQPDHVATTPAARSSRQQSRGLLTSLSSSGGASSSSSVSSSDSGAPLSPTRSNATAALAAAYPDAADIVMDGWIMKKGDKRRAWKLRWFVMTHDALHYFDKDKDGVKRAHRLGIIELREVTSIGTASHSSRMWCFHISTATRCYMLYASAEELRNTWMSSIHLALKKAGIAVQLDFANKKDLGAHSARVAAQIARASLDDVVGNVVASLDVENALTTLRRSLVAQLLADQRAANNAEATRIANTAIAALKPSLITSLNGAVLQTLQSNELF